MRKTLMTVLSCLALLAAALPARADDTHMLGENTSLTMGYKLWINTWETSIGAFSNGGSHVNAITAGPTVASVPNLSLRYKNWLLSGSYLFTGNYSFPAFKDTFTSGGNTFTSADENWTASRTEADLNAGYYFTPNLVATLGYKNVEQKYNATGGAVVSNAKTHYNGVTAGIGGSAGIGAGFALYGNAAGGLMAATYTPSSGSAQTALYEASEVGVAWHHSGFGASVGYKFQYLTTHTPGIVSADVTRGYMLGASYTF